MFFKKLFAKDYRYYVEKGEKYLADERYVDARHAFLEALQKTSESEESVEAVKIDITNKLAETGFKLALMNLTEAEYALSHGDMVKADEHIRLATELGKDPIIREKADILRASLDSGTPLLKPERSQHHCSSCSTSSSNDSEYENLTADHLSLLERFELQVQTLPGNLPERYSALGEKFAEGYILAHEGDEKSGFTIFNKLLSAEENDIYLYEIALINHRSGNLYECEQLLRRAMTACDSNPLCYLGLVQLLTDLGRFNEAIPLLNTMLERKILIEQATIFLGDIFQRLGNDQTAMDYYSTALTYPSTVKAAAERLVVLLQKIGRSEEAAFLAKKYLKGCC